MKYRTKIIGALILGFPLVVGIIDYLGYQKSWTDVERHISEWVMKDQEQKEFDDAVIYPGVIRGWNKDMQSIRASVDNLDFLGVSFGRRPIIGRHYLFVWKESTSGIYSYKVGYDFPGYRFLGVRTIPVKRGTVSIQQIAACKGFALPAL
ncbi:MAG: hypothetical protein LR015_03715 [Verrucomicrobia bacterium]|nr:hypothetical protein [Verrucomicrobiota bacterium]